MNLTSTQSLGPQRIVCLAEETTEWLYLLGEEWRIPEIIIGSWCAKKFRPEYVVTRPDWGAVRAVETGQVFEVKSADILQPGPAALTDGVTALHRIVMDWSAHVAPS